MYSHQGQIFNVIWVHLGTIIQAFKSQWKSISIWSIHLRNLIGEKSIEYSLRYIQHRERKKQNIEIPFYQNTKVKSTDQSMEILSYEQRLNKQQQ